MSDCLVSFGSNLGDRQTLLAEAAKQLSQHSMVADFRASRLFSTPSVGGPGGQSAFLNAVAAFQTEASAHDVLGWLQVLEQDLGRRRKIRWDARSIDLDVVLYGDLTGDGSHLIVPHPRYTARTFVLVPACDIVPQWQDPRFGWTIERLTRHIQAAPPSLALIGGDVALRNRLCQRVAAQLDLAWFAAPPLSASPALTGNAPTDSSAYATPSAAILEIDVPPDRRWIAAAAPRLPADPAEGLDTRENCYPRLIVRLQHTDAAHRWPAPHQIWPKGGNWPEYRLEIGDEDWAVEELIAVFDSLQCPVTPSSQDGHWF